MMTQKVIRPKLIKNTGFTLIETVLAISTLALSILMFLGVFTVIAHGKNKSQDAHQVKVLLNELEQKVARSSFDYQDFKTNEGYQVKFENLQKNGNYTYIDISIYNRRDELIYSYQFFFKNPNQVKQQ